MLMYHPAQDINHCIYRLLLILETSEHIKISTSVYRLVDFYTVFPYLLKLIKPLPASVSRYRSKFADIQEPFESLKNTKRILHELEILQSIAIQNLLAKNLLDQESFKLKFLKRSEVPLPAQFLKQLHSARLKNEEWFKVLVNEFPKAKFNGNKGLKAKTGLMEYRYDMEDA
jgi:hypothetical protein